MIKLPNDIDLDLSKAKAIKETEKYICYEFDNLILKVYDKNERLEDNKDDCTKSLDGDMIK
ncbi:hypothetical protein [Sphingobacterium cavernae]|uniref:hypothetical protein n=1 Tax=Sphingobacterium cavernae TaxID=2592657 RepID=UPI0012301A34|nr:hypothetical protein [Sphingobacterium cavernae]